MPPMPEYQESLDRPSLLGLSMYRSGVPLPLMLIFSPMR